MRKKAVFARTSSPHLSLAAWLLVLTATGSWLFDFQTRSIDDGCLGCFIIRNQRANLQARNGILTKVCGISRFEATIIPRGSWHFELHVRILPQRPR